MFAMIFGSPGVSNALPFPTFPFPSPPSRPPRRDRVWEMGEGSATEQSGILVTPAHWPSAALCGQTIGLTALCPRLPDTLDYERGKGPCFYHWD